MFILAVAEGEFANLDQVLRFAIRKSAYGASEDVKVIKFFLADGSEVECDPRLTEYLMEVIRPMVSNKIEDVKDPGTKYFGMDSFSERHG